jgi:hypothetical protein
VLYQLVNLATFDATTDLNTKHLPWTPQDHFFVVHVRYFGIAATARSVMFSILLFLSCATVLVLLLLRFLLPHRYRPLPACPAGEVV